MIQNNRLILNEKKEIIAQIKKYVPLFEPFFDLKLSLKEFSEQLKNFKTPAIYQKRQTLIKSTLLTKLNNLFGSNSQAELNINLPQNLSFNIADHHQVLSHPFLLSANIISSVGKFIQPKKQDAIVVISSGDVPPNNYFSKSGFCLHGKRVPLFSVREREYSSYYIPKRKFDFTKRLKTSHRWHEFNLTEQNFLNAHEKIITGLDFSKCQNYIDQITVIIKNTWPLLFEESLRQNLPELLYVTQEELITEVLTTLLRENNFVTAALFDSNFREKVLNNFRGNVVAWRESETKGTHFFWMKYPGEPRSIRLYLENGYLVPQHPQFKNNKIKLEPQTIIELLNKKEIYPSLFTIFSVLNFYTGVKPLTGFGSAVYLSLFKEAWQKTLKNSDFENELTALNEIDTAGLVAGLAIFFRRYEGQLKALYAHDIFCDGPLTAEHLNKVFDMKYADVLAVGTADMYDYFSSKYVPAQEKIKKTVTFNDLAKISFDWV